MTSERTYGLTLLDQADTRVLSFDVREILIALGGRVDKSVWLLDAIEAVGGNTAQELNSYSDSGTKVHGTTLRTLVDNDRLQVIDGWIAGYAGSDPVPWVTIRAVDSTFFEVTSPHRSVIEDLRSSFKYAEDMK